MTHQTDNTSNNPGEMQIIEKTPFPQWRIPKTRFEYDFLKIFGMKFFPTSDKGIYRDIQIIQGRMILLKDLNNPNRQLSPRNANYPIPVDYVAFSMNWAKEKRRQGRPINPKGLITMILDHDGLVGWLEKERNIITTCEKEYITRDEVLQDEIDPSYKDYAV